MRYIDGDTVVLEDPAVLYGTDLTDCYAGVVKDYNIIRDMSMSFRHHVQQVLQMEHTDVYFNSGVLVLNLDLIRRDFSLPFFMEQAELKGAKHHDQDVLNSLFYGKVRFLPPRYNSMWQNEELYAPVEGGLAAVAHPAIVLYPGGGKPWLSAGADSRGVPQGGRTLLEVCRALSVRRGNHGGLPSGLCAQRCRIPGRASSVPVVSHAVDAAFRQKAQALCGKGSEHAPLACGNGNADEKGRGGASVEGAGIDRAEAVRSFGL